MWHVGSEKRNFIECLCVKPERKGILEIQRRRRENYIDLVLK